MSSAHFGPMKHFVKGSEEDKTSSVKVHDFKQTLKFVSGTNVKQFYDKVVGKEAFEESNEDRLQKVECILPKKKEKKSFKVPFNINTLMKAVETGNVKDVEKIMEDNDDKVNSRDQFGWTPLMSACCAGNRTMVEFLLKWRPRLDLKDKKGHTCQNLASARGHMHILEILKNYQESVDSMNEEIGHQVPITPFYCKTCKQNIENTPLKKHLSSTIHNFIATSKKKMPTMYGIPESNKGYQILLKSGWDKETGLGPSGEGHKFPPKTILKQDRTGLGAKHYKPRVTHSLEDQRREAKPKDTFKRKLQSQKRKEQRLERNLRQMLS